MMKDDKKKKVLEEWAEIQTTDNVLLNQSSEFLIPPKLDLNFLVSLNELRKNLDDQIQRASGLEVKLSQKDVEINSLNVRILEYEARLKQYEDSFQKLEKYNKDLIEQSRKKNHFINELSELLELHVECSEQQAENHPRNSSAKNLKLSLVSLITKKEHNENENNTNSSDSDSENSKQSDMIVNLQSSVNEKEVFENNNYIPERKFSIVQSEEEKIEQLKWTKPKQRKDIFGKRTIEIKSSAQFKENGDFVGYIYKKQGKRIIGWKKRWFKLVNNTSDLFYYKSQSETKPEGKIDVKLISIHKIKSEGDKQYCFNIVVWDYNWLEGNDQSDGQSEGKTFTLATDTESDLKDWIKELNKAKKSIYSKIYAKEGQTIDLSGEEMNKNFVTDWQQQLTRVLTPRQKSDASVLEGSHLEKIRGKFSHIRSKSYDKKSRNIEIIIDRDQTTEGSQRVDSPLHDSSNTNTPLSPRDERRKDSTVNLSQEDKKYWLYNKVITEFIATEKDYHRDMEILATVFMASLGYSDIATEEEIKAIFGNVLSLLDVSRYFIDDLSILSNLPLEKQNIGEITLKRMADFEVFIVYCDNQPISLQTIDKLTRTNPEFSLWIERIREMPECNRLGIGDYLIKPFQRLCKYPLLLKEILTSIPSDFDDRESILKAKHEFESLLKRANETKRNRDNLNIIQEHKNKILWPSGEIANLMKEDRYLIKKASFQKILCAEEKLKGDIFLFHDIIAVLVPREKGKRFVIKTVVALSNCAVWESGSSNRNAYPFSIITTELRITIHCSSAQEKYNWMVDISEALPSAPPADSFVLPRANNSNASCIPDENNEPINDEGSM